MRFGRREALRAGALAVLFAAGCTAGPEEPPPPDPLAALAERARADAATAKAVAAAVPALADAANQIATARAEHATALRHEVDRMRPPPSSGASSRSREPSGNPPAGAGAARKAMLDALLAAEREAAKLIGSVPRYRAGLVGSVAAGCASLREVLR